MFNKRWQSFNNKKLKTKHGRKNFIPKELLKKIQKQVEEQELQLQKEEALDGQKNISNR